MKYSVMLEHDIERVIDFYINYYNESGGCWTRETAYKRIHQVWSREDAFCLLLEEDDAAIGFIIGSFSQYDDLVAYDLNEIVIDKRYQNRGLGTAFILELEQRVKQRGASLIQLSAVNDAAHEHFYDKLNYKSVNNLILKSKFI